MKHAFLIGEAITFSWTGLKKQFAFFIFFLLIGLAYQIYVNALSDIIEKGVNNVVSLIIFLVVFFMSVAFSIWQVRIAIRIADNKPARLEDIRAVLQHFWRALVTEVLYSVIVLVGLLLFIVPGVYWAIKYQYALYFVIDKSMQPFDALDASGKLTKGSMANLFFLALTLIVLNILGFLTLLIGLFITIPITIIAPAYAYRRMQKASIRSK